ncbi:hypothetical protein JHK82_041761 [Glycine max]|nr:hypothetical protein JHK86_041820 [Glycine max]KAG5104791.1 hypothetical protein JHK82_041761 [Glycine max]KAG5115919.1 hypothetical protein JHK84_042032 [Glycine max]
MFLVFGVLNRVNWILEKPKRKNRLVAIWACLVICLYLFLHIQRRGIVLS